MATPAIAAAAKGAASKGAETAVAAKRATPRRVKFKGAGGANYTPVTTTLTVLVGMGVLKSWLGDKNTPSKALPERKWWVNMAILGFILSLMAETTPRLSKGMAYLTLTTGIFIQGEGLLERLQEGGEVGKPAPKNPTTPVPVSPLPGQRITNA